LDWNASIRVYLQVPQKSLNTFIIILERILNYQIKILCIQLKKIFSLQ